MKKLAFRLLGLILLVVGIALAGTFVPRPLFPAAAGTDGVIPQQHQILVLSNPIHTDIAIPLDDAMRARFAFLGASGVPVVDPGAQWLIIGWGGRAFYLETPTWADLKPMPAFRALTVDSSVMHVDVSGPLDENHPAVTTLDLGDPQFQHLIDFIIGSFAREAGEVMPIADAGYGEYDRFYEANGYFNALTGCNTWTAAALRSAGLRTGLWNPLPQTLTLSLRLFN